jgi:hypothetical protein
VVAGLPERLVVHLDAGYDYQACRRVLAERGQYGKLRWCTERRRVVVEFWLLLALALIVRNLIRRAWTTQRWNTRPSRRP